MNIGARLYLGFGVVIFLLLTVYGVGKWGMSSIDSEFSDILKTEVRMMQHSARARANALGLRRFEKDVFINVQSKQDVEKYLKSWRDERAKVTTRLDDLDKLATLPNDKKLLGSVRTHLDAYEQQFIKVIQKIQAGEIKSTQEANLAMGDAKEATHKAVSEVEDFSKNMMDRVTTHSEEVNHFVGKIAFIVLGISLVAVLIGIVIALLISRSITLPLLKVRDAMNGIAASADFSRRVDVDSRDEVGQAAAAFNALIETQQKAIGEVNGVVSAIAAGDFSKRVEAELKGDLQTMKVAVNASAESVKVTMDGLNEVMKALYNGDFSQRMSVQVKGEFKLAVDQAMQAMQAMLSDVGGVMAKVSDGDLSQRVTAEGRGDLARLKENINASLVALSSVMKAVGQNTQQVAAASNQTSNAIGQISDGAQNQMHAINQVATAVQQTAAAVTEVAKSAESANARAQGMGKAVNEGIADMNRMVEIVQAIATNADRIDKITDVIEKIANKTNLLSLNAAIEAARAGEHGKGFAVVAEEVGKLAASAGESTQEIAALVKQAVEDADRATGTVAVVNKGMQEISNGARQTEAELQRISAAMEQQNAAITEINANVGSLNRIASANASAAEEITSTVIELARLADGTRREVEKFST